VFDHGKVSAEGTADDLKDTIGGDVVEFSVIDGSQREQAVEAMRDLAGDELSVDGGEFAVRAGREGSAMLIQVVRKLDAADIRAEGLGVRRPSLDDVFLALTGHKAEESETDTEAGE
jgi:ABC-2 type transport system ATP-binding protein